MEIKDFQGIWNAINKGTNFFIAGHLNPDGDSLGSTLTLTSLLERLGKKVYAYAAPSVGKDLTFLPGIEKIHVGILPTNPQFDTVILLECSDRKRGGDLESVLSSATTLVNIDHHLVSDAYGNVNHIDPVASSTAEILFQLFEARNPDEVSLPTPSESTCLYTGLVTDTGRFVHTNTTPEALRVAAALIALGADVNKINQIIYFTKGYTELKLLGRALEKMQLLFNNKYSQIVITQDDFNTLNAKPEQTQGIVSQPTMIPGVEVSVLIKEEPDKISINLRSRGQVDVSKIAQVFGGGGHARAAGCKIIGKPLAQVVNDLATVVQNAIK